MTDDLHNLVDEAVALTGADAPGLLNAESPTLGDLRGDLYLVGLIGGKEVGKTSLVNALVGEELSAPVGHGRGTETAIAYAHEAAVDALRPVLDEAVPGKYRIVTHANPALLRQVLLDLPDIDSKYADHVEVTRRVLRHLLFPVWVQSVEKYADRRPQDLLRRVAEGNDPANFLFVLNKADQLIDREGLEAAGELSADYAGRLRGALDLDAPPEVFLASAQRPAEYDLPRLAAILSRQREARAVDQSRQLAVRRQSATLLDWLDRQDLPALAARAERLATEAEEVLNDQVGIPLLEGAIPRLADDPAARAAVLEPAVAARLRRWPVVNAIDALLGPVAALVRKNLYPPPAGGPSSPDAYLGGRPVGRRVQGVFARLHQQHPEVADAYRGRRLWEDLPADTAAAELRDRLADALARRRAAVTGRLGGPLGALLLPVRWGLTLGALLWFPFAQPVLSLALKTTESWAVFFRDLGALAVEVISAQYLVTTLGFLAFYFLGLWAWLRYDATRRVSRRLARAGADDGPPLAAVAWMDELLSPLRDRATRVRELSGRVAAKRAELADARKAA